MNKSYREIIRRFFSGHFGLKTRSVFYRFLSLESSEDNEKETAVTEFWDDCVKTNPDATTIQDWNKVCDSVGLPSLMIRKSKESVWKRVLFPMAAIICVVLSWFVSGAVHSSKDVSTEIVSLSTKAGEMKSIMLPDSTIVWINNGTTILYPTEFSKDNRTVYLSGEARFNVAKDATRPFLVKTSDMDIKALGTVFDVRAYPNEKFTSAALETGIIQVTINGTNNESAYLKPNERLMFNRSDDSYKVSTTDAVRSGMWHDGYLVFDDADISTIISAIELKYNVEIAYNSKRLDDGRYTIQYYSDESLEDVLIVLQQLTNIRYSIKGNKVFLN